MGARFVALVDVGGVGGGDGGRRTSGLTASEDLTIHSIDDENAKPAISKLPSHTFCIQQVC